MGDQRWARGWRRRFLAAGMLAYPAVTAAGMAQRGAPVAGYVLVVLFACCYVVSALTIGREAWPLFWSMVAAMTVLFVALLPFAQADGFFLAAVVAPLAAVNARRYAVVILLVAVVASVVVPIWFSGPGWVQAITIVFTALTMYGYAEIAAANHALVEARAEVARLASEAERARIARDLHDLLGHSLTAITVKSDLARRSTGTPRGGRSPRSSSCPGRRSRRCVPRCPATAT